MYLINNSGTKVIPFVENLEIIRGSLSDDDYVIRCGGVDLVYGEYAIRLDIMSRFIRACSRGENVFHFGEAYGQLLLEKKEAER